MLKQVQDLDVSEFKGLQTYKNVFKVDKGGSPNCIDIKFNDDGSMEKRLGAKTMNSVALGSTIAVGFTSGGGALTNGLISYWRMDETTGPRMDSAGSNNLLGYTNLNYDAGKIRYAAKFEPLNSSNLYYVGNPTVLAPGNVDFSYQAWINMSATGAFTVLGKSQESDPDTLLLLHFDHPNTTAISDSSIYRRTAAISNGALQTNNMVKFGSGSMRFLASSGQALFFPDSADWDVGLGNWTVAFWTRTPEDTSTGGSRVLFSLGDYTDGFMLAYYGSHLHTYLQTPSYQQHAWYPNSANWYHIAFVNVANKTTGTLYINGIATGPVWNTSSKNITGLTDGVMIGGYKNLSPSSCYNGNIDELIISKRALWPSDFTPPPIPFANPVSSSELEYRLWIDSDNIAKFSVSTAGTTWEKTVACTSFGALTTSTWYHLVGMHSNGVCIGVSVNASINSSAWVGGVKAHSADFMIGSVSNATTDYFPGLIDEVAYWKTYQQSSNIIQLYNAGNGISYDPGTPNYIWGMFDFGASSKRWMMVAAGTGIYATSNLGVNFVSVHSARTGARQSFELSKNVLVITSDAYDNVLYWDGSGGTQAQIMNPSAPVAKYCINHQGWNILLNTSTRKRGFYYEDDNTQLTGAWNKYFDLPSSYDDEITGALSIRKLLYVSTKYKLFRVSFVGGNPDWSYLEIKDFGYAPRTFKKVYIKDVGEVAIGFTWDRRMRLFDGAEDKIISDPIEEDNGMSTVFTKNISYEGSGLSALCAEVDVNEQVYALCVPIGLDSEGTTHLLNLDGKGMALYPYQNQPWQAMCMAESANRKYLMCGDRSGYVHMLNTSNTDNGVPINDNFESALAYQKSPSEVSKSYKVDLYFANASAGTIYFHDRIDFDRTFRPPRYQWVLSGSENKVIIKKSVDLPSTQNVMQFRFHSSASTADPWVLARMDYMNIVLGAGDNP